MKTLHRLIVVPVILIAFIVSADNIVPELMPLLLDDTSQNPPPPPPACNDHGDSDGDRLKNCYETNTGTYISVTNTGTNPAMPDTDGDGINDGDEVLGTQAGLNLPALGTNPLKKNILLEYDWFNDSSECAFHSHRPTPAVINRVALAFAAAPVSNPDGTTGITVLQDYGQGGVFNGGNQIFDADGNLNGGVNGAEFIAHKNSNFASNRHGYFHYVLFPHRYNTSSSSSGQAELPGDDNIVSLYCFYGSTSAVANTIMHELGHNLNLRHGGNQNCNHKPNYNSVMNYRFQFDGIDGTDCDAEGNGILSYSRGNRINLNESALNENAGVCGSPAIDWNNDSVISSSVAVDINSSDTSQGSSCGGTFTTLRDYNDWMNIYFLGIGDADGRSPLSKEIITETITPHARMIYP